MTWVLDLDGVVWLAGRPLPGSPEAIAQLRAAGHRVLFLTNNSGPRLADHVAALEKAGVPAAPEDVVSSAHAAASLLEPGSTALVLGGPGVVEALEQRGVRVLPMGGAGAGAGAAGEEPDAVVVGRTVEFGYDELARASTAVRDGARFVATNLDPSYPTPDGLVPGAGAIVAAVQVAAGRDPEVAGKPFPPTAALVRQRADDVAMVVGDRLDTDGAVAHLLDVPFGLVLTGVTAEADLPADPPPDFVAADLATLVSDVLTGESPADSIRKPQ